MRPVSIEDFINVVFEYDSTPPAPSTIRRLCAVSGVNYLVRFATTMMAGWVVLLFTLSSLLKLLLSPVAFPL